MRKSYIFSIQIILSFLYLSNYSAYSQLHISNNSDNSFSNPIKFPATIEQIRNSELSDNVSGNLVNENEKHPNRNTITYPDSLLPDAMQEYPLLGAAVNDNYGFSASAAGDVNGDGFDDFIIGAPFNDAFASNSGLAYIYFGGPVINTSPDVVLTGIILDGRFGYHVGPAGDVNRDGFGDVLVSEMYSPNVYLYYGGSPMNPGADVVFTNIGISEVISSKHADYNDDGCSDILIGDLFNSKVYLYYGGTTMDNSADLVFQNSVGNLGNSISSAGDVNGDGYPDIIIGNFSYNTNQGRAYIYFGGYILDNVPDVTLDGENIHQYFGVSVSGAGDVNGDGYDDVIAGAYLNSAGNLYSGRAYIYFGGSSMDNTADKIITGKNYAENLGISVSVINDVNGDGYDDVITGARGFDNYTGRSYVFFGGSNMNTVEDVILTGNADGDNFGFTAASAGDVNRDGYADILATSYLNDESGADAGKAFLYTNTFTSINIPINTFTAETAGDKFGESVSDAGDVNGDGYDDVIVGAYAADKAYIYFGGIYADDEADKILVGSSFGENFGVSVSSAGDVNGDGYDDVIVGAHYFTGGFGKASVFYGGQNMDLTPDVVMIGEGSSNYFGFSVSKAGDVNLDGYDDVIVGAYGYANIGRSYVFYGGASMNNVPDAILSGEAVNNYFGYSVSTTDDVNGDGFDDVIVGAPGYSGFTGRAYVYFGGIFMSTAPNVVLTGSSGTSNFGLSVSNAGRINNDGYSDVIVGANTPYNNYRGEAKIYYGGVLMDNTADVTIDGINVFYNFGYSVSKAGDLNKDGFDDVVIGAPGEKKIFIYYGGTGMDTHADHVISDQPLALGYCVSTVGDFDGDGYPDIIAGASGSGVTGKAYVYKFPQTEPDIVDEKLTGQSADDHFGFSVSSAGDVNGDGFDDLITGAPDALNSSFVSAAGKAYIYFGGQIFDYSADVILEGSSSFEFFGYSVSKAGDVNADGYADVIVGAPGFSSNTGRAFVFFGSAAMDNVPDVTLSGAVSGDNFGWSVSSGNFNGNNIGDIWSDVIVGSPDNDDNGLNSGSAVIYFGGSSMNNIPDLILNGASAFDRFGFSVAGEGDVNGDAYSDFIIGAPFNDAGGSDAGAAYVYLGNPSSISSIPFHVCMGNSPQEKTGFSVSSAGKTTSDIYDDVIIGSPGNSVNGVNSGKASLYLGGVLSLSTGPAVEYFGYGQNNNFGYSVASAGDIDFNGLSDLIIGATGVSKTYVYRMINYPFPINSPDIIMSGESATDSYGLSVSSAGDINGDGYGDMITGAPYNDTYPSPGNDHGSAYVHLSSSPVEQCILTLKAILQGFYDAASNTMNTQDTFKVNIRNANSPYNIINFAKGVISKINFTGKFYFRNTQSGNYYLDVRHRNSIETWSAAPFRLTRNTNAVYNFTEVYSKTYGNNVKQIDSSPFRLGIYNGDVNQDGIVDASDVSIIDNDVSNFATGYIVTDLTGDYITDASDALIADNNAANFVSKTTP